MYIVSDLLSISSDYPLSLLHPQNKFLFFDIETTGLSPLTSSFYLIGCLYPVDSVWHLRQWFCESMEDELPVLHDFFSFLMEFEVLIHFNGDTFDIPYLTQCAIHYGLTPAFDRLQSVDLLRKIRPYKKLLHLTSLRQISLEHFLHIVRDDRYNGGELISVYQHYLQTHDETLRQLLLLHNHDDLTGMSQLLPLLSYEQLFSSPTLSHCQCRAVSEQCVCICAIASLSLPNFFSSQTEWGDIAIDGQTVTFQITPFCGELKHFYSDYKNYYYLPMEDMAIHQKVAQFVDSHHKKKATASTAYSRQTGLFLPLGSNYKAFSEYAAQNGIILFQKEYREKAAWILFDENPNILTPYMEFLLVHLSH